MGIYGWVLGFMLVGVLLYDWWKDKRRERIGKEESKRWQKEQRKN